MSGTFGILGVGKSGLAAARALRRDQARVVVYDDCAKALDAAQRLGFSEGSKADLVTLDGLVVSPGVPLEHRLSAAARALGVPLVSDIDLLTRKLAGRTLVGVTGTNGKSTTTALIRHLIEAAGRPAVIGGNYGVAALALDLGAPNSVVVLELSSFQLDLMRETSADIAVLLNITPDHLDRHKTLERYVAAKRRLFELQANGAVAVIGVDDEHGLALCDRLNGARRLYRISTRTLLDDGVSVMDGRLYEHATFVIDLRDFDRLRGVHNHQNVAAAFSVMRSLGYTSEDALFGLASFRGLPHRLEEVGSAGGTRFVNDSKATNPEAAARSLACFDSILWIAGGRPKPGGFGILLNSLDAVHAAFLIGEAQEELAEALGGQVQVVRCGTLDRAVEAAWTTARQLTLAQADQEATVLLAPACASFDQFRSFEDRGTRFTELVRQITKWSGPMGSAA